MSRKVILAVLALALLLAVALPMMAAHGDQVKVQDGDHFVKVQELEAEPMVADPECPPGSGQSCG